MSLSIGIDIGGTNMVFGVVDEAGNVLKKTKLATEAHLGQSDVLERIVDTIQELRAGFGEQRVVCVGIGLPGLVDPIAGISRFSGNLNWRDIPVAAIIESQLGIPVSIDNDVRMYVYGEAIAGAGRGYSHVMGITIGTGIAAAMVHDGKLHYGHKAMAGEIGHVRMDGVNEACACGMTGCLETIASASGMVRAAKRAIREGSASLLNDKFQGEDIERLAAADLSDAMDAGDSLSRDIITRAGTLNGRALAAAVMVLSPEIIIVGGGGALAGERILAPLREELNRLLLPEYRQDLVIAPAQHNDEAGIIGSSLYARHKIQ